MVSSRIAEPPPRPLSIDRKDATMDMPRSRQFAAKPARGRKRSALDIVMRSPLGPLLSRIGLAPKPAESESEGLLDLAGALLSLRGRASGPALASAFFDLYEA